MSKIYSRFNNKKEQSSLQLIANYIGVLLFFIIAAVVIWSMYDENRARDYYLSDLRISQAVIAEKDGSTGKNWLRLDIPGIDANPDDLWIEVNNDFFFQCAAGDNVGVLLGKYDVFLADAKFSTKGKLINRRYEKTAWSVEEVYKSMQEAEDANPKESFTVPLTLKEKKANKYGAQYFILEANGKNVKAAVNKQVFAKFDKGQKINGEFESIGGYVRFIKLQV